MLKPILAGVLLLAAPVFAQQVQETIEVTATRIAEDVLIVPASITVVDGDEIRARNATDLASALSLVAGVNAMGGSDAGPASGVPEMWGLREVDAFLLVVDSVPGAARSTRTCRRSTSPAWTASKSCAAPRRSCTAPRRSSA